MAARPGRRRQAIASRGSSAPGRVTPLGGAAVASFEASNEGAWCSCVWTVNRMTCGNGLGVACVADDENSRNASLAVEALACHGAEEAVTIARGVVRTFDTSSSRPLRGRAGVRRTACAAATSPLRSQAAARLRAAGHAPLPAAIVRPPLTLAANLWLAKLDAQVAEGARAATTADTYRQRLHSVILPAMGQWRLRECAVPRLDAFFTGLAATQGAQSRKTVRTVVSLILRLAVQHEAIVDNPVRHLDPMDPLSRWTTRPQSRISWSRSPRTCSGAGPVAERPDVPPDPSGSTSKRPRVSGRPQPRVHRSPGGLPAFQEDQGR
jgi:hypothetical protein